MGQAAAAQEQQPATPKRKGREGARWINERPTPNEFANWAKDNIPLDPALDIEDYLGGIVLIPAEDKRSKYVAGWKDGVPILAERPELVYVPYAKVEVRLQYFWDLLDVHTGWRGVIEPITTPRPELNGIAESTRREATEETPVIEREIVRPDAIASIVYQLPPGFFIMPVLVPRGEKEVQSYALCCSYRVAIYDEGTPEHARPLREGRGTKQVALLTKKYRDAPLELDENALMKAETGAIGRALGAAGIFTIPGSGIATAEDMLELAGTAEGAGTGAGPAAPEEAPTGDQAQVEAQTDEDVLATVKKMVGTLREDFPEAHEAFGQWCDRRRPKITALEELEGPALRGVRTKVEKLLEEARKRQQARGEGETAAEDADGAKEQPAVEAETASPAATESPADGPQEPAGAGGDAPALI